MPRIGHAKEGYGPLWEAFSLSRNCTDFQLKKVPLTHLPASAVPGDGVVAPAHYGAAQFVEILPMSDAHVENLVSNSTPGTSPAIDALKTSETTEGARRCPDSLHLLGGGLVLSFYCV